MNKSLYKKRLLSLVLALALALSMALGAGAPAFAAPGDTFSFRILFTSDLHGSFSDWRYSAGGAGAGLARIATQIESRRTANTILIDVGDAIQGNGTGIFHSAEWDSDPRNETKMYPVIAGMELLGYDAWVLGNHEFNFGIDRLDKAYGKDRDGAGKHGFTGAILAGNVYAGEGNIYGLPPGARVYDDFFVKKFDGGPNVAIVGMVHPDIVNWDHGNVVDEAKLYTTDPAAETQKTIAFLKTPEAEAAYGKIDIFIAAQHMSSGDARPVIAQNLSDLDLFIGAHGHSATNSTSNGVRYVELSGNAGQMGQVDVRATQQEDGGWKVADKLSTADVSYTAVSPGSVSLESYRNSPAIVAAHAVALAYSQLPVGELAGGPLVAGTVVRGAGNNFYTFDSAMTHLFHDAFRYYANEFAARTPELAGTGRKVTLTASCPLNTTANPPPGPLTRASIGQLYQYDNNTLCIIELTGYQAKVLAEYGYSSGQAATASAGNFFPTGNASNSYDRMMIDGITYKVDSSRPAWDRVYDIKNLDGTPFDLDGVYWMAANNHTTGSRFLASGSGYALQRLEALPDSQRLKGADGGLADSEYGPGMPIVRTWTADEVLTVEGADPIFNAEGCTGVVADYIMRVLGGRLTNEFYPNWRYDTTSIPSSDWVLYGKAVEIVNADIGVNREQASPTNIRARLADYAQPLWDIYAESLGFLAQGGNDAAAWGAFLDAKEAAGLALLGSGYAGSPGSVTQQQAEAAYNALEAAIAALRLADEPQEGDVAEITVFFTSDLHGAFWNCNFATVNPSTGQHDAVSGLPRVAAALKGKQAELAAGGGAWLTIDVGDTIEGKGTSAFIGNNSFTNPMMKGFNYLGYDAVVLGNHEFNYGVPNLLDAYCGNGPNNGGFNGAKLCANAFMFTGDPDAWPPPDSQIDGSDKLLDGFKAYEVFKAGGLRVAVIGMTAPGSDTWDAIKLKSANVYTESAIGAATRAIHQIKDAPGGPLADVIVLAAHMSTGNTFSRPGSGANSVLADPYIAQNVDVFLGAHGHSRTSTTINGVRYGENAADGNSYGEVKIKATYSGGAWGVASKTGDVSVTMNTLSTSSAQDEGYLEHLQPEYAYNEAAVSAPIGQLVNGPMVNSALKGTGNYSAAYIEPTKMVEFIHDVQNYFANSEISVACPFSPQMQHPEGPISRGSLGGIYRYDSNTVYRLEMKGWQVAKFMEYVVQNYYDKPTAGQQATDLSPTHQTGYNTDNLGGVRYTVDLTKANGSRVSMTQVKRLSGQWEAFDPNETYIVAANDYRTSSRILTTSVFTQAELDGESAPAGNVAFAPAILETDCTRGHETAPDIISLMAFYVGMKGGVIDALDFERNWSIVPWWETTIEDGAYLRAQGERLTQEGKITNVTSSSALKAADVLAALAQEQPAATEINIFSFNDFHGTVDNSASSSNPGMARFTAIAKKIMGDAPNATLLAAGDNYQGSAISNFFSNPPADYDPSEHPGLGDPVSDMMKELGVKYSAIGNHDYDWGPDKFARFSENAGGLEFLAANVFLKATGERPLYCKPYATLEIGGKRIGLVGWANTGTPTLVKADYVAEVDFRSNTGSWFVDEVNAWKAAEKWDAVIALTHGTLSGANLVGVIDGIVTGHSHSVSTSPTNGIPTVQAGYNGRNLGRLQLVFDNEAGGGGGSGGGLTVTSSTYANFTNATHLPLGEVDAAMQARYDEYYAIVSPFFNEQVGVFGVNIDNSSQMAAWANQLVYDFVKRQTGEDDYVLIQNSGGWRSVDYGRKPDEPVDYWFLNTLMPFDNEIYLFQLKGEYLVNVLNARRVTGDGGLGSSPVITNAHKVGDDWYVTSTGEKIDPEKLYKVSMNDFMFTGGDNYGVIAGSNTGPALEMDYAVYDYETLIMGVPLREAMAMELRARSAPQGVSAGVRAAALSNEGEPVEFAISLGGLDHANTAAIEFTLSGGILSYNDGNRPQALAGFTAMPISWTALGGGQWKGSLTLACLGGTVTSADAVDVVKLFFDATGLGDATVALDSVTVTMQPEAGGEVVTADAVIAGGPATTSVVKVYSIYDLNQDGAIGQVDLAIVALACGLTSGSPLWDQQIAINAGGRAITPAMCDVNGDGEVDMLDLMDVFLNYAASY